MRDKIVHLINKLIERNSKKDMFWSKTSSDSEFKTTINKATITIEKWNDEDGENFEFCLYNSNGEKIEEIHIMESQVDDNIQLLKNLYNSAVENYFKVDETIDGIIDSLNNEF